MSVPSNTFHSLSLKLPIKGMNFPFPPLKLSNKGREEYSKIILFIHFHSIPFLSPKRGLSLKLSKIHPYSAPSMPLLPIIVLFNFLSS